MCVEKYPLRTIVTTKETKQKTAVNSADVITTRQLHSVNAEQLYEIEKKYTRQKVSSEPQAKAHNILKLAHQIPQVLCRGNKN